jgi:hypothetical protein
MHIHTCTHTYTYTCNTQGVGALREVRALRELISNTEFEAYKARALADDADRTFHFGHGARRLQKINDNASTNSISDMFLEDTTAATDSSGSAADTATGATARQLKRGIREPALTHPSKLSYI